MARADLMIHTEAMPRTASHNAILVREDVAFTNAAGREKSRPRKFALQALQGLAEPLGRLLTKDEVVLYVCRGATPMGGLERYSFGYMAAVLASSALVLTNKRLLVFRTKSLRVTATTFGNWTRSLQQVAWGDVAEAKVTGWFAGSLTLGYRSGRKERFWGIAAGDKNKLKLLVPKLLQESQVETTTAGEMRATCPECSALLTRGIYECSQCGLVFKNEQAIRWRVLVPGAAYLYTGHPVLALADGLGEFWALVILLAGIARLLSNESDAVMLIAIGLFALGLDAAIAYAHNRRFVREFLPTKEHKAKFAMSASAGR